MTHAPSATQPNPQPTKGRLRSVLLAPARFSAIYLLGSYLLFMVGNLASQADNLGGISFLVIASYLSLYLGFRWGVGSKPVAMNARTIARFGEKQIHRWLILAGCLYFVVWGINQTYEFGATSGSEVIRAIMSPGEAYRAKFEIYRQRLETSRVSRVTQLLVLLSVLYAILVPLGVASWPRLRRPLRLSLLVAVAVYIGSFLFIGTMKGIGDVFLFAVAGGGVLVAKRSITSNVRSSRRRAIVLGVTFGFAVFGYMVSSQIQRAEQFGITASRVVGDISGTFLAATLGEKTAFGIYLVLAYPSHGYLGLSYSMQQPFEFSYGAGLSQAWESYRYQFFGGEDHLQQTYPFRAEAVTGWPAGQYWSTIFPWLASDLTFPAIPLFMLVAGFVFARVWIASVVGNSVLALAALGQFVVFVAFIPANNQVLMQRQGFWIVASLILLYLLRLARRRLGARMKHRTPLSWAA